MLNCKHDMKIKQLNQLATEMVGDGGKHNVFFVSLEGNVQLVTTDFWVAYEFWKSLTPRLSGKETMLEDRKWGVICDRSPIEDGSTKLQTWDDSESFLRRYPKYRRF